jgi:hypothetical protein
LIGEASKFTEILSDGCEVCEWRGRTIGAAVAVSDEMPVVYGGVADRGCLQRLVQVAPKPIDCPIDRGGHDDTESHSESTLKDRTSI